jgi:hypothetical protein
MPSLRGGQISRILTTQMNGYDTKNDTKTTREDSVALELVENMVELVGIEPTTSSLRTMRSPS